MNAFSKYCVNYCKISLTALSVCRHAHLGGYFVGILISQWCREAERVITVCATVPLLLGNDIQFHKNVGITVHRNAEMVTAVLTMLTMLTSSSCNFVSPLDREDWLDKVF